MTAMNTAMTSHPTLERLMLFTGNANPKLAQEVAKGLNLSLGRAIVGKFSDGEVMVELLENVRGKDVFVLQSTCAPTNDNLMELLVMIDALKRSSAARVTAAIPYFGYARQDRRPRSARVAISAKVVANALASVGVARVLTMDLHADQIQGFFDIPVDNIYAAPVLLGDVWKQRYEDLIVVSPDVGGVVRARALAKRIGTDLAIVDKRLAGRPFILGSRPTIADVSLCAYLYYPAEEFGFDIAGTHGNIAAWLDRIKALPGWKHPYELMPGYPPVL